MTAGKVLLGSFTIRTLSCTGCTQQSEGVKLSLRGQRNAEFSSGFPCSSSATIPLNHQNKEDFGNQGVARFDGSSELEQNMMGDCYLVNIYSLLYVAC